MEKETAKVVLAVQVTPDFKAKTRIKVKTKGYTMVKKIEAFAFCYETIVMAAAKATGRDPLIVNQALYECFKENNLPFRDGTFPKVKNGGSHEPGDINREFN